MRREDAQLIELCLSGQVDAFAELIDRYQKPLFNTALRMTGDYEEARDITQNTFVKAYERLNTYRAEFKFFSWIYRILLNESINVIKQRGHEEDLDPARIGHSTTPESEYEISELSTQIDKALRELSFEYRMVIVLRHFNDLSYEEMADLLAIPVKTVKSRLYTARQNLAAILERMGATYQ